MNIPVISRILVGLLLIFSGAQKLIGPYQNFLYLIESYDFLPELLELVAARVVPWVEFLIGIFLFLGLWLRVSLVGTLGLFICFIIILGQALIRGLPITDCGCFGEAITIPPVVTLLLDVFTGGIIILMLRKIDQASRWSLDAWYNKN